ncbi:hypothetical protein RJT34_13048 [Clitoria ternatea]|uniref:3'-5' exonuclease domain-containing protein n=1 Tax=Clitoria ternatea TaxID=43366 RepID=A0AAN9JQW2_CLITE
MGAVGTNESTMIFFDSSVEKYMVLLDGQRIETTVTNKGEAAEEWVQLVSSTHQGTQMVVGLDTEWTRDDKNKKKMKVAILQLCVEDKCLIFQLAHMDYVPHSLRSFLIDSKFVGVGIMQDIKMLRNGYELECKTGIDVATLANTQWPGRFSSKGLKYLAKELVGLDMKKSKDVCTSEWKSKKLTNAQIEYACIDAYASYMIGKKLLIQDEQSA